jgi:hypothetical protein
MPVSETVPFGVVKTDQTSINRSEKNLSQYMTREISKDRQALVD